MLPFVSNIGAYLKTGVNYYANAPTSVGYGTAISLNGPGYAYESAQIDLYLGTAAGAAGSVGVVAQVQQSADGSTNWTSYTDLQGAGAVTAYQAFAFTAASGTAAATYVPGTGILTITISGAPFGAAPTAVGVLATIASITGTGAGCAALNGVFPVVSITSSGTVINVQAPVGLVASGLSNGTLAVVATGINATMNVNLGGASGYVRLAVTPTFANGVTSVATVGVIALGGTSEHPAI